MLINGEKFACEACVRGHRVSSCNHTERQLIHVNKKGRPVSQCQHCRGLRKARSQHVKCDCAEMAHSKEDCPHEKADHKDHQICCCGHGARCNCSLKKEHLDTVPEDIQQTLSISSHPKEPHKHRISSLNSHESKMTVFKDGHHKPVHKINDAHNRCGAPYKIPGRSHTIHGHREIAQKSSDSLPLTKTTSTSHETPKHHESVTSAPQPVRQVKSEHGSPDLKGISMPFENTSTGLVIPALDPNAYSYSPFGNDSPGLQQASQQEFQFPEQFPDHIFMSYEQAHTYEPPLASGGLSEGQPDIDWSTFNFSDSVFDTNNKMTSQPPSYASFDHFSHLSHPGLTSSSGEISEVDESGPTTRPSNFRDNSHDTSNDFNSTVGDDTHSDAAYRLSSASSYIGTPQAALLANPNLQSLDIDDYIQQAETQTRLMAIQNVQPQQKKTQQVHGLPSLYSNSISNGNNVGEHPFTVQEAQKYAHPNGNSNINFSPADQKPTMVGVMNGGFEDPMWSLPPETPNAGLDLETDDEEYGLIR